MSRNAPLAGFGRTMLWSYAGTFVAVAGGLLTIGITARELGLAALGVYGAVGVLLALIAALDFGLSQNVIRASAITDQLEGSPAAVEQARLDIATAHTCYVAAGATLWLLSAPLSLLLLHVIRVPAALHGEAFVCFLLLALASGLSMATAAGQAVLAGRRRYDVLARATMAGSVVSVSVVVLLIDKMGLPALGVAQIACVATSRAVILRRVAGDCPWWEWVPQRRSGGDLRRTASLGLPLLAMTAATHLLNTSDALIVGAVSGAVGVGALRLGTGPPTQAVGLLLQGYDTVLPVLSRAGRGSQEATTVLLTRLALYVGATGLGVLMLWRGTLVQWLAGQRVAEAELSLVFLSFALLTNVAIHGWAILLIARSAPQVLLPCIASELAANIVLTFLLVHIMGPAGAALGTLIAMGLCDLVLLPVVLRRKNMACVSVRHVIGDFLVFGGAGFALAALSSGAVSLLAGGRAGAVASALVAIPLAACGLLLFGGTALRNTTMSMARAPSGRF